MDDIEKEIENDELSLDNIEDKEEEKKEEMVIRNNRFGSDKDKKKRIFIIILIILLLLVISVVILFVLDKNDRNSDNEVKKESESTAVNGENSDSKKDKFSYVSCDDNTSLLNVRNSISGDVIDGLSCFKEVEILEETEGTETCDKWYRVSYEKRGKSYTGYVCSKYIKESTTDSLSLKKIKNVIDKANQYYEANQTLVYCGETSGTKTIKIDTDGATFDGVYAKSEFKTIEDLKKYLLTFLDESLIKVKLELDDFNNPKMYDNYYEIDGNLYCRDYSGKGWLSYYTGNYDIEVVNDTIDKIILRIVYEYIDSDKLTDDSRCSVDSLSNCLNSNFKYVLGDVTLIKDNGNYIVRSISYHD